MAKIKTMEKINEEKDWSVRQGVLDGEPIFVSFRFGKNTPENRTKYPFQIGVAVPLLNPTVDGLPIREEAEKLWKIEDELITTLRGIYDAQLVMTITIGGMREFVFYTPKWLPQDLEKSVKEVQ